MKDITDLQALEVVRDRATLAENGWGDLADLLSKKTGQPAKVCERVLERCNGRDLLEYGVSLNGSWITKKGWELLGDAPPA